MEVSPRVLYSTTDRQGATVSLRVLGPGERELLDRMRDADEEELLEGMAGYEDEEVDEEGSDAEETLLEALLALDEDEWQGELFAQALDLEWVPTWWTSDEGCTHPEECRCGPVSLLVALAHLQAEQRAEALTAHLQLLSELAEHHAAATALGSGELSDTVCVGCIVDVDAHLEALDDALADAGRALGEAVASGEPVVRIKRRRSSAQPSS